MTYSKARLYYSPLTLIGLWSICLLSVIFLPNIVGEWVRHVRGLPAFVATTSFAGTLETMITFALFGVVFIVCCVGAILWRVSTVSTRTKRIIFNGAVILLIFVTSYSIYILSGVIFNAPIEGYPEFNF
jgi:hypothetical protein